MGSSALLAFTAGAVDTIGFIGLTGFFPAHITGNLVLLGASLSGDQSEAYIAKLLAIPVFMLAVGATTLVQARLGGPGESVRKMFGLQALLLALFMAVALAASPVEDGDAPLVVLASMVGLVAMAIQCTIDKNALGQRSPTTVMTGNVTLLALNLVGASPADTEDSQKTAKAKLTQLWPTVAGFALGAAAGAVGYSFVSFWALLLPIVTVTVAARITTAPQ
jgi:uncharacterized membrane protein YoaK (UPF0700 family)